MNKARLEALSDGFFAIVMTILVFEVKLPSAGGARLSDGEVWELLQHFAPLVGSYFLSFAVLAMFWISHHKLFHYFTRTVNRIMVDLNMVYLMFLSFVPFSAHLIGQYWYSKTAMIVYGANILAIALTALGMYLYAIHSHEIDTAHISSRMRKQALIRLSITPASVLVGIVVTLYSIPMALFFYIVPVVFNTVPGGLSFFERVFHFRIQ